MQQHVRDKISIAARNLLKQTSDTATLKENSMGKPKPHAPPEYVALYEKLIGSFPDIEMKGAANPYTSMNGHMFSFLTRKGILALRLSSEDREAFLKKFKTQLSVQYGTVMKEYVEVPSALFEKTGQVKKYFAASVAYVGSLKPKPTTKKKTKSSQQPKKKKVAKRNPASKVTKKVQAKKKQSASQSQKSSIKKKAKKKARKKK